MESLRKPGQGVYNIVRFNWHFYVYVLLLLAAVAFFHPYLPDRFHSLTLLVCCLILFSTLISLLVSWYVYDCSELYTLKWLDHSGPMKNEQLINIHAGFDETSELLRLRYPGARLQVFDFYDPAKHTEVSIKRARKAYPAFPGTQTIGTSTVPERDNSADMIFVTLSAHEIRDDKERIVFFNELRRILKAEGRIVVTEHLRDLPNFLAYNIGFFHFLPKAAWKRTFEQSQFRINKEVKITPFINVFILEKHDPAS
ncbi:MAG: hypothetical protein K0S33_3394 [Bacteroidetes bacterium]|jgi:SAM-dependent methyltransferase|nr:hypothetical protein [Bacteroidota bacterium]